MNNANLYPNSILVKLDAGDDYIALRTYERGYGGRGRFLIDRRHFRIWFESMPETEDIFMREFVKTLHDGWFYGTDCGHILTAYRTGQYIRFRVTWLSECDRRVHGIIQCFDVAVELLRQLLEDGISVRALHCDRRGSARISCNPYAAKAIRRICGDRLRRHAFRRAMRDCFKWKGDMVTLSHDGRDDFYFSAEGSWPISGGLILHETAIDTPGGTFPKLYYGIHT